MSADEDAALATRFLRYRREPALFVRQFLRGSPWSKQEEVLAALVTNDRVSIASCHGVGKTHMASWIAWWFALCHRTKIENGREVPATTKVVITAPSRTSAEQLLAAAIIARWEEMRARFTEDEARVIGLGDRPTQRGWRAPWSAESGMEWFATREDEGGETGHASRAAGRHADHLLFLFEEASGVRKVIWDSIRGSLFGAHRVHVAQGNPVDPTSPFAKFNRAPNTKAIRISALDFPNVVEGRNVLSYGPTRDSIAEAAREYGEGSAMYAWKVLGLFPGVATDTLMGYDEVNAALERATKRPHCEHPPERIGIGLDVARASSEGADFTSLCAVCRACERLLRIERRHGQDVVVSAGMTLLVARGLGMNPDHARQVAVDDGGVGGGVTDILKHEGWTVRGENFGASPKATRNEEKFANRRLELWWMLRDWIRGPASLADLPADDAERLRDELTTPKFWPKSDGRVLVLEPKDDIRKRIGRSPDDADALALALSAEPIHGPRPASDAPASAAPLKIDRTNEDAVDDDEDDRAPRIRTARRRFGPLAGIFDAAPGSSRAPGGWDAIG